MPFDSILPSACPYEFYSPNSYHLPPNRRDSLQSIDRDFNNQYDQGPISSLISSPSSVPIEVISLSNGWLVMVASNVRKLGKRVENARNIKDEL